MTIHVGDRIPEVTLKRIREGIETLDTHSLFDARKVVLFAVPGAFTPTCSARHLPGFKDHAADFKAKGVDAIACVSVNDAFVMGAWAKANDLNGADDVVMLADGNGDFTRAVGLALDAKGFGMGERSQRYSMLVKDGKVATLNVEGPGKFEVSDADTMLAQAKA